MTRIALISDIHSNLLALRAVLDAIERTGVDQVICLGDVANLGPEPNAVIEILAELGCPCIMGNHDEFLLKPELALPYDETPASSRRSNGAEAGYQGANSILFAASRASAGSR